MSRSAAPKYWAPAFFVASFGLAGCASGPTVDDAQELLANGDADGALQAIRAATKDPLDDEAALRARRIAFEASLALGRSDEAARDFLVLRLPVRERERLREKLAGGTLRAAFESPDAGRRALAAAELAFVGAHPKIMILAEAALSDVEPVVRRAAIATVARIPDAAHSALRLAQALGDPDEDVQAAAALALAVRIGRPRTGEPVEFVEARAKLVRASTSEEALALVGAKRVASVVPALERASEPGSSVESLVSGKRFDLIRRDLTAGEASVRRRAWLALDRLEPHSVDRLCATLAERDPALAPDAARLLAERGGTAAVPPLLAALADGAQPARVAAAQALGALGGPEAVAALLRALKNEDGQLRRAAAEALARSGNAAALEDLARSIADPVDDSDLAAAAAVLAIEARTGSTAVTPASRPQEGP